MRQRVSSCVHPLIWKNGTKPTSTQESDDFWLRTACICPNMTVEAAAKICFPEFSLGTLLYLLGVKHHKKYSCLTDGWLFCDSVLIFGWFQGLFNNFHIWSFYYTCMLPYRRACCIHLAIAFACVIISLSALTGTGLLGAKAVAWKWRKLRRWGRHKIVSFSPASIVWLSFLPFWESPTARTQQSWWDLSVSLDSTFVQTKCDNFREAKRMTRLNHQSFCNSNDLSSPPWVASRPSCILSFSLCSEHSFALQTAQWQFDPRFIKTWCCTMIMDGDAEMQQEEGSSNHQSKQEIQCL